MVKRLVLAAAVLGWASAAWAGEVDWRRAGGALLVESEPAAAQAGAPPAREDLQDLRVPPLRQPYGDVVAAAAERFGLDPKLLQALVAVESGYRPQALSPAGAGGLTQLMPATAADLGVRDRFDPTDGLFGGAEFLALQIRRFNDLRLALAAYNAGPARVAALGRVPAFPETRAYVTEVVNCYLALAVGRVVRSARDCPAEGAHP
jgi:soluble lytic murein transglycosylase-like protein